MNAYRVKKKNREREREPVVCVCGLRRCVRGTFFCESCLVRYTLRWRSNSGGKRRRRWRGEGIVKPSSDKKKKQNNYAPGVTHTNTNTYMGNSVHATRERESGGRS